MDKHYIIPEEQEAPYEDEPIILEESDPLHCNNRQRRVDKRPAIRRCKKQEAPYVDKHYNIPEEQEAPYEDEPIIPEESDPLHCINRQRRADKRPAIRRCKKQATEATTSAYRPTLRSRKQPAGEQNPSDNTTTRPRQPNGRFAPSSTSTSSNSSNARRNDTSWKLTEPMEGGPVTLDYIPSFKGHYAMVIIDAKHRDHVEEANRILTSYNRYINIRQLRFWMKNASTEVRDIVQSTGLAHLPGLMYKTINQALISAFVERWQPDTNTFHMPWGEMTILLHDVERILGVRIEGEVVKPPQQRQSVEELGSRICRCEAEGFCQSEYYSGGGIVAAKVYERWENYSGDMQTEAEAMIYMLLGCTLFVDKSSNRIRSYLLEVAHDQVHGDRTFSWGSATLALLYHELGMASRAGAKGMGGCMSLLQCWILEYFPQFRPTTNRMTNPSEPRLGDWIPESSGKIPKLLLAYRQQIEDMDETHIDWLPYEIDPHARYLGCQRSVYTGLIRYLHIAEPYTPARCLRQFGYRQVIPPPIRHPMDAYRPAERAERYKVVHNLHDAVSEWAAFPYSSSLNLSLFDKVSRPYDAEDRYLPWFEMNSRRFLVGRSSNATAVNDRSMSHWMNNVERAYKGLEESDIAVHISQNPNARRYFDDLGHSVHGYREATGGINLNRP